MKKYLFLIGILLFTLSSCNKDSDDDFLLKTNKSEIVLSSTNKQDTFTITSNGEWRIESPSLSYGLGIMESEGSFYILSQGMGNGNATITVKLKDETDGNVLKETLTIKGKNTNATILLKKE